MGVSEFDRELFKLMQRLDQDHGVGVLQGAGGNSDTNVRAAHPQMTKALKEKQREKTNDKLLCRGVGVDYEVIVCAPSHW